MEVLVVNVVANTVERRGVWESQLEVICRFAQPDAPMVLPLVHLLAARCKAPENLVTFGDHLRRRRLEPKLLQKDMAKAIGVTVPTVINWERNHTRPEPRHVPAIIKFLGYNPLPDADTPAKRFVTTRTAIGLSQKDYAKRIGMPWWKLANYELGLRQPELPLFLGAIIDHGADRPAVHIALARTVKVRFSKSRNPRWHPGTTYCRTD